MTPEERFGMNRKLIYMAMKRYAPQKYFDEDLQQIAAIGLWKACQNYDGSVSRFSTFGMKCIFNELSKHWRIENANMRKEPVRVSLNDTYGEEDGDDLSCCLADERAENDFQDIESRIDFAKAISGLSKRQQAVAVLRANGFRKKEIARMVNVPDSTVQFDLHVLRYSIEKRSISAI